MLQADTRPVYASGDCEIDVLRRELRVLGSAVPVGGRAFEIIQILAESAGKLVTKDELMNRVWPGAIVMDNTLQVHAAAVRKALGPYRDLLKTESRRGYRLLGSWTVRQQDTTRRPSGLRQIRPSSVAPRTNLPASVTHLVGRTAAVQHLQDVVSAYRIVTLTGPGGIGKTALALQLGRNLLAEFADGCWFIELASLSDPTLVPSVVASVLGLTSVGDTISSATVAGAIGAQHLLLILDNCEHLIGAVAELVETIVRLCPNMTLLTTSREIIRTDGEQIYRVPPLDVPRHGALRDILDHSAVEFFVAKAKAFDSAYSPNADALPLIGSICQRLDGIPLAIEFAAAGTTALGIEHVARSLNDRFALLRTGRRTALPRHQTLRAAPDWSYDLLPDAEKTIFRRLAVFRSAFSMVAAQVVASGSAPAADEVWNGITNLVNKSLVTADIGRNVTRFRLLETLRAYALEKLDESGELGAVRGTHAKYLTTLFRDTEANAESRSQEEWLTNHGPLIDDCRAALDWAFSPDGDIAIGVGLVAMATPFWVQMSLMSEFRRHVERALASLPVLADRDERIEMMLHAALGASLTYTTGPVAETFAAWSRTLQLAERRNDADFQLRALRGLWSYHMNLGEYRRALACANEFCAVAEQLAKPATLRVGDRMVALLLHYLGEQKEARKRIEWVIDDRAEEPLPPSTTKFMIDQGVAAQALLARILWLQGFPEQAMRLAERALAQAEAADHVISVCHALAQAACPVALWTGDLAAAARFVAKLIDLASENLLQGWIVRGKCFRGVLSILSGDVVEGSALLESALQELPAAGSIAEYPAFLASLAQGLARAGQIEAARMAIDEAMKRSETTGERWSLAELLRIQAEILLTSDDDGAEYALQRSLDIAHDQGVLSLELRTAIDLARLWRVRGRIHEAHTMLASIYDCFSEGFATADLKAAGVLIGELERAE